MRLLALALGVGVLFGVTKLVGTATVGEHLAQALPWLPLLFVLEGARVPLEAVATRRLLGARAERVSLAELGRAQLLFYAISTLAPGGRLVAEASKATLLARNVGAPTASAAATGSQAASLVADAIVATAGAGAVVALCGPSPLSALILGFVLGCVSLAVAVAAATRSALPVRLLARFPRLARFLERWRRAARAQPLFAADVVGLLVLARAAQVGLLAAALAAVGADASFLLALALTALCMAGAVAGEVVPAQLGATDAVLVAAAPALGLTLAQAASVGVLFHVAQLGLALFGVVAGAALSTLRRVPVGPA
jgi:uncharacterized membrane protein YbhN (UPF0104 family)